MGTADERRWHGLIRVHPRPSAVPFLHLSKTFFARRATANRARRAIVFTHAGAAKARPRARENARRKFPPPRKKALTRIFHFTKLAHEKGGDASAMAKKKKSSKKTTKKTTKKK